MIKRTLLCCFIQPVVKDGIALLDMLAGVFDKVICYYMYLIPNLDHVQPYIKWAENHYKNVEVRKIRHFQRDYYDSGAFFVNQIVL